MAQAMASDLVSMPVATPRAASVVSTVSVGILPDQFVAGERAAAQAGERAIEATASGLVGGENFFGGAVGAAVQVHADLDSGDAILHGAVKLRDVVGRCGADGIRKRNGAHADVLEPDQSFFDDFRAPRFIVGIPEGHGNVNHEIAAGGFGVALQLFDQSARFGARHVGIGAAEIGGDGVRIADRW